MLIIRVIYDELTIFILVNINFAINNPFLGKKRYKLLSFNI